MRSNTEISSAQIKSSAARVADLIYQSMMDEKAGDQKYLSGKHNREDAYRTAHDVFRQLELLISDSAIDYRRNRSYRELQDATCVDLSTKLGDNYRVSRAGEYVFSSRVKKQWSRLVINFRENGSTTQSEADRINKARAKRRISFNNDLAESYREILNAFEVDGSNMSEIAKMIKKDRAVFWGK
jgi:hypothetical protein